MTFRNSLDALIPKNTIFIYFLSEFWAPVTSGALG